MPYRPALFLPLIGCLFLLLSALSPATAREDADLGVFLYPSDPAQLVTVREGTPYRAAIPIRNPYDRAIKIIRTDSTCVCNILKTDNSFLLPGEETILHFEVPNERISGNASQIVWLYLSDPEFEPLEIRIRWQVQAIVAVDVLPANQRSIERPADNLWRDIYRLESVERPEDGSKLVKNMLLSTSPGEMPEGGLELTGIEYSGTIWSITSRKVDDLHSLLLLRATDPDAVLPQGTFEETFTIRTNHPDKPEIIIELGTMIDPDAGRPIDNPLLNPPMP